MLRGRHQMKTIRELFKNIDDLANSLVFRDDKAGVMFVLNHHALYYNGEKFEHPNAETVFYALWQFLKDSQRVPDPHLPEGEDYSDGQ